MRLSQKHVSNSIISLMRKEGINICTFHDIEAQITIYRGDEGESTVYQVSIPHTLRDDFKACPNIAFLHIGFSVEGTPGGHANALLFERTARGIEIERYEPHGSGGYFDECDEVLEALFRGIFDETVTYFPPSAFCPLVGHQAVQDMAFDRPYGYCATWSALYIYNRLHGSTRKDAARVPAGLTPDEIDGMVRFFSDRLAAETAPLADPSIDYGHLTHFDFDVTVDFFSKHITNVTQN